MADFRSTLRKAASITPTPFRRRLLTAIGLSALLALFDSVLVVIVGPLVEGIVKGSLPSIFGMRFQATELLFAAGAVLITKNLAQIALSRWKHTVLFKLQAYFSAEALHRILRTDYLTSSTITAGRKSSYVMTEPMQAVLTVYTNGVLFTTELALIVFVTLSLLVTNPYETIAMFGTLALLIGAFQWMTKGWLYASGARRRDADARRHDIVRAVIDSEVDVRALGWTDHVQRLYRSSNQTSSAMVANKAFATDIVRNVVELAVIGGVGLLVLTAASRDAADLAPLLAVFGAAAYRIAPSFNRLMVCSQSIRYGAPSLDVLHEMLQLPVRPEHAAITRTGATALSPLTLSVCIDALTAPTGNVLARGKSFTLSRGDTLVITGPSGIGKSTLLKALIDGNAGLSIVVNGMDRPHGIADCGLAIGMAGQRPLVLPSPLGSNVLPRRAHDERGASAQAASDPERQVLEGLADSHPGAVIDRGTILNNLATDVSIATLSGGQAQRIALMRALLLGDDVLLLDEPTSALDSASRDRFMDLVRALAPTRIVIIVSHDPELERIATHTLKLGDST